MPGLPVVLLEVMLISGKPENEIHKRIVRPGKHFGTGGRPWLASVDTEESRDAFRLNRVVKLDSRRPQHFQQIRHPAPNDLGPNATTERLNSE